MKRRRLAFGVLLLALIAILATGFYRAITHQEARPDDGSSPALTDPQH